MDQKILQLLKIVYCFHPQNTPITINCQMFIATNAQCSPVIWQGITSINNVTNELNSHGTTGAAGMKLWGAVGGRDVSSGVRRTVGVGAAVELLKLLKLQRKLFLHRLQYIQHQQHNCRFLHCVSKNASIIKQTYTKAEGCKLYCRLFWVFLLNIIKINP